ncbi:MAG: MMPL family transporter [Candidatus Nanohaloarchaea archaeon]
MNPLEALAEFQLGNTRTVLLASLVLTVVLGSGIPDIQLQTDFQASLPDDLPPIMTKERVEAKFGNTNSIIVLVQTTEDRREESYVTDMRDPRVVEMLNSLERELDREPMVSSVNSMGSLFRENPDSKREVKKVLRSSRGSFLNRDYTATTVFVRLKGEMTEENIAQATTMIEENIEQVPKPPGVKLTLTGLPVVRNTISSVLVSDSYTTIAAASALILILLIFSRGAVYGPITFVPLFMGLIWTLGFMGHFGIPLSFATISLGSMILGLGVEYGSFITERIIEEMEEKSPEAALRTAVPNTGKAIVGSAMTDGVGFLALLLASFTFIRDLGVTLALGEFLTVSSALVVTPSLIIEYRRWKDDR